jgi:hypothetical protein
MSLARALIEFYTAPFFPTSQLATLFFHELGDRRAWIVGSIALAALSFSCDLVVPNNLNVITSALTEDAWITFFRDHFGYKLRSVPCSSFYVKLAQSRLIFTHDDIKVSCLPLTRTRCSTLRSSTKQLQSRSHAVWKYSSYSSVLAVC